MNDRIIRQKEGSRNCMLLIFAVAAYAMNLYDMFCTMLLVKNYGISIEGNPIGKLLLKNKAITVIVKAVCMGAVMSLIYLYSNILFLRVLLYVLFGIYSVLTIYHTVIIIYLKVHKL